MIKWINLQQYWWICCHRVNVITSKERCLFFLQGWVFIGISVMKGMLLMSDRRVQETVNLSGNHNLAGPILDARLNVWWLGHPRNLVRQLWSYLVGLPPARHTLAVKCSELRMRVPAGILTEHKSGFKVLLRLQSSVPQRHENPAAILVLSTDTIELLGAYKAHENILVIRGGGCLGGTLLVIKWSILWMSNDMKPNGSHTHGKE